MKTGSYLAQPRDPIIAAIDVGTNAARLEIARVQADSTLETLHQERSQIRPGEGTFTSGAMPRAVVDRLLATMRRYGALCRRYRARVRAVATSAVREAKNRPEIVRRIREESGLELEVVSGREEARLICLGVLHDRPASARSLVVDIGGGSTEVASAVGDRPTHLWSVALGAVRVTEEFGSSGRVGPRKLSLMRSYAAEILARGVPRSSVPRFRQALGSSGTINAVVSFAADEESYPRAGAKRLSKAVEELAAMTPGERAEYF
ncbi:MAG TPA: Ppx/GppA family phosphatase, partial [Myxococcaceae bacterium]|nr:Ppx/GppA family phosphatase [Myxococcaceae bacterium]